MINLRPLPACNSEKYFTFPASDVWSETIQTFARKATLTRMPRKIRLPHRLASYLRARFKHLSDVVWWIWDHFWHEIRRNTLHFRPQIDDTKKSDFLNSKSTVGGHSRIIIFVAFPAPGNRTHGNQAWYSPIGHLFDNFTLPIPNCDPWRCG